MKTANFLKAGLVLTLASAGCATASPPADLLMARASYDRVQHGVASKLNPADLHTAELAMQDAERSFAENGDTAETRDLAYTADRRSQIAEARANAAAYNQTEQTTINSLHANQASQLKTTSADLDRANQELVSEREARADAETRAAQAAADLAKFASVKTETRGMVITLSGGVLFASSKSELLPAAQVKLNSVADALTQQDPDSKMVVEGHTDSQGGTTYNQDLSQRRAASVRDYLVSRGIAADRVTSQGFGATRSIADNTSAEGRANNRRVEIVVEPKVAKAI